jgi:hypothetical protein
MSCTKSSELEDDSTSENVVKKQRRLNSCDPDRQAVLCHPNEAHVSPRIESHISHLSGRKLTSSRVLVQLWSSSPSYRATYFLQVYSMRHQDASHNSERLITILFWFQPHFGSCSRKERTWAGGKAPTNLSNCSPPRRTNTVGRADTLYLARREDHKHF